MIIPSIDIMDGQAVQLIGGETKALEAGDPMAIAALCSYRPDRRDRPRRGLRDR